MATTNPPSSAIPTSTVVQRLFSLLSELVRHPTTHLLGNGREGEHPRKPAGIIEDLKSQVTRIPENVDLLGDFVAGFTRGGLIDDREYTV